MSAKRGDLGLQQLEPELAKSGEDGALLVNTLVVPIQSSLPGRSAKASLTVGVHSSLPRRRLKHIKISPVQGGIENLT